MTDIRFAIPSVPVLFTLASVLITSAWLWLIRRGLTSHWHLAVAGVAALYATAVLGVTLLPIDVAIGKYANQTPWYELVNVIPVLTIDLPTFVLNIVMFLPLGVLLPLLTKARTGRQVCQAAFAASLGIEVVQLIFALTLSSGRSTDINDIIANILGALLGYLVLRAAGQSAALAPHLERVRLPLTSADVTSGGPS